MQVRDEGLAQSDSEENLQMTAVQQTWKQINQSRKTWGPGKGAGGVRGESGVDTLNIFDSFERSI